MASWTSKLGNKFLKAEIEDNDQHAKAHLNQLRKIPSNRHCADCGQGPTVWASVNIGVFLCLRCGSIHRGIGTHISIPKGCTGTYLWGPDEIERMRSRGNEYNAKVYGGDAYRPLPDASDECWRRYIIEKYEYRTFVDKKSSIDHKKKSDQDVEEKTKGLRTTTSIETSTRVQHQTTRSVFRQINKKSDNIIRIAELINFEGYSDKGGVFSKNTRHGHQYHDDENNSNSNSNSKKDNFFAKFGL
jgi:hypothetical protein